MKNPGYQPMPLFPGNSTPTPPNTNSGVVPVQTQHGCICPPTSEQTCQGWNCPRRKISTLSSIS